MTESKFDAARALTPLKGFQRRTVDYVFDRLFGEGEIVRHFLVADEVGLGKTMVARGVIAKTIERLWDTTERIDVLYICSNQAIAAQNVNRLNVLDIKDRDERRRMTRASRLNLIPLESGGENGLAENKVNFISLTPATTFDPGTSMGVARERAFLFRLLEEFALPRTGLRNLLQGGVGAEKWRRRISEIDLEEDGIDKATVTKFQDAVKADAALLADLGTMCEKFGRRRDSYPREMREPRNRLVGRLRAKLSRVCVDSLQPDLIVLDEFQRYTELLYPAEGCEKISEAAELAQQLFNYTDASGQSARTLLLSATPYRMLTLRTDADESKPHHEEFLKTVEFLFGADRGAEVVATLQREMSAFRGFLQDLPASYQSAMAKRDNIESTLRRVIARTERVDRTVDRNSMTREIPLHVVPEANDLRQAVAIAAVARVLHAPNIVEYWKSSPYLLNFMRDYKLKTELKERLKRPTAGLRQALQAALPSMLTEAMSRSGVPIDPGNGRMRALARDVFSDGLDRRLWIPPSLPYCKAEGDDSAPTKSLVFSAWSMAPDAIAALLSHEAERRSRSTGTKGGEGLLQFRKEDERLTGLRVLLLLYPSATLAAECDPLSVFSATQTPLTITGMRAAIADRLRALLLRLGQTESIDTAPRETEWLAPAAIDRLARAEMLAWVPNYNSFDDISGESALKAHLDALAEPSFAAHVEALAERAATTTKIPINDALIDLLVDVALGSPAVCAARALRRIAPELAYDDPALLQAATTVASGFRTLFNLQDSAAVVRQGEDDRYWHRVLSFCAENELQAVLDEYAHFLLDAEGLTIHSPEHRVKGVTKAMVDALSIRPSQIEADEIVPEDEGFTIRKFHFRGRLAMRLGAQADEEEGAQRLSSVRAAFNSPFKPFVLASTSVGQEGLDFHPYCHRIYHWNLPGNPVDLEQREGRIHRYKNHAVRLNLAKRYGTAVKQGGRAPDDPWAAMFVAAKSTESASDDLVPYWVLDGDVKVERRVPMFSMSREAELFDWLKRSLTVYRLAFGQPRQDDLLAYLGDLCEGTIDPEMLRRLQITLEPTMLNADITPVAGDLD